MVRFNETAWHQLIVAATSEVINQTINQGGSYLDAINIIREVVRNFELEYSGTSVCFTNNPRSDKSPIIQIISMLDKQLLIHGVKNSTQIAEYAISKATEKVKGELTYIPTRKYDVHGQRNYLINTEHLQSPTHGTIRNLSEKHGISTRMIYKIIQTSIENFHIYSMVQNKVKHRSKGEKGVSIMRNIINALHEELQKMGIKDSANISKTAVSNVLHKYVGTSVYIAGEYRSEIKKRNSAIISEYQNNQTYEHIKILAKKHNVTTRNIYTVINRGMKGRVVPAGITS